MQIIINAPDDMPSAVIEQQVEEFENKLKTLNYQPQKQVDESFEIDEQACLAALAQVKQGDKTGMTEIKDVDESIKQLGNAIKPDAKPSKWALLAQEITSNPDLNFAGYSEQIKRDAKEVREGFSFPCDD